MSLCWINSFFFVTDIAEPSLFINTCFYLVKLQDFLFYTYFQYDLESWLRWPISAIRAITCKYKTRYILKIVCTCDDLTARSAQFARILACIRISQRVIRIDKCNLSKSSITDLSCRRKRTLTSKIECNRCVKNFNLSIFY